MDGYPSRSWDISTSGVSPDNPYSRSGKTVDYMGYTARIKALVDELQVLEGRLKTVTPQYTPWMTVQERQGEAQRAQQEKQELQSQISQVRAQIADLRDQAAASSAAKYGSLTGDATGGAGATGSSGKKMDLNDMMSFFDKLIGKYGPGSGKSSISGGNVPAAWDPGSVSVPKSSVNPMAVINAAKPRLQEELNRNMSGVAQRLGQMGVPLTSGGYAEKLGQSARKGASDLGELTMNTLSTAAENQAQREQEAQQSALDRSLSGWGTRGNWEFESGRDYQSQWSQVLPQLMQLFGNYMMNGQGA